MAAKNDNTGRIILVIVAILVLSALGYFATRYFTVKGDNDQKVVEIEELKNEVVELEDEIVQLNTSLEDQNLALAEKDRLLSERDLQLEELNKKLNRYRSSNAANQKEAKELQNRLELLRTQMNSYEKQIQELQSTVSNQSDTIATQRAENYAKTERITDLQKANEDKQSRLQQAGVLQAADFIVYNVRKEGSKEIRDTEFKRGRIKGLKICYNLLKNSEASPGPREVYMVMENPDGTVSTNTFDGYSGDFSFEGRTLSYSAKTTVNYSLTAQQVCTPYSISGEDKYQKGEQYISIYSDGHLIGQTSFMIK